MDAGFTKTLKRLAEDIFACFLQPDYESNLYLYEHRIHSSKIKCISLIQKHARREDASQMLAIYNGLIDCGLLRWRIKDKSLFSICRPELSAIGEALAKILSGENDDLSVQITALESINQSVLQVTAKEPLAFLLFIGGLKALKENCVAIHSTAGA